jgi:hypothetical protein
MQLMPALSRGFAAALLCCLVVLAFTPAARAAVVDIPRIPPSIDPPRGELRAQIVWDPALENRFGWRFAQGQITTACNDVRAGFPTRVAMMRCALQNEVARRGVVRRTFAFLGDEGRASGGGGVVESTLLRAAPSAEVVPTPLPPGVLLLASALGGLVVARRATRRSENARTATFAT